MSFVPNRNLIPARAAVLAAPAALMLLIGLLAAAAVHAAVPESNGLIAFNSDRSGNEEIWIMEADGSNPVQLTSDAAKDRWPIWSPDGKQIAFHSERDGGDLDIFVMDADGGNQTNLTNNNAEDAVATWSPDGKQIAFWSNRNGNPDIWIMDADGSNPTQLTTDPADDVYADWSPDGTKILFSSTRDGHGELYVINVDGTNETRLTFTDAGFEAFNGVFSPDGTKIAFNINDFDPPFHGNIYLMNADGSGTPQALTTFSSPDNAFVPQWSPDGSKIYYTKEPDGGGLEDVFVINADGSGGGVAENLTNLDTAYDFYADQQPLPQLFVSTTAAGTTNNSVGNQTLAFGREDVLRWNGSVWSLFFDGSAHGLTKKHDVNAIHVNAASAGSNDIYLSFFQNKISVPGLGNVRGNDILHFADDAFGIFFDGSDVELTTTSEKIDALHVLDGSVSPIGSGCDFYLLISTLGSGRVMDINGDPLRFDGEDVLGFCATNTGNATAGFWHLLVDGSAEGMPKNSTDSLSANADGSILYLTTKGTFNVDDAFGGHSMVYQYDFGTEEFSGPFFSAPANGLSQKVDGLQVEGELR